MVLPHAQVAVYEMIIFSSKGSNGAGKNEFEPQFICLQWHFYVKRKRWIYNQ